MQRFYNSACQAVYAKNIFIHFTRRLAFIFLLGY